MRVLVIEHDHASDIGPIGERFEQRGYDVTVHPVVGAEDFERPWVTTSFPDFTGFDAVVPMGAPWSAYDDAAVGSWVRPELEQLTAADAAGVPVLGICFGGQLLAQAHGGTVALGERPEIGWYDVSSSAQEIVPDGPWFQWHYDAWNLPPGATEIARNANASQAFVLRRNLALQFHPELTTTTLLGWLDNGGHAKAREVGIDPADLVARTRDNDERNRSRAHRLVDGFLGEVATGDADRRLAAPGTGRPSSAP